MARKRGFWRVGLCNLLILSLTSWPLLNVKEVRAKEVSPLYIGEVMATGDAFLTPVSGQGLRIDRYPMPVVNRGKIKTGDGTAVVTLSPDGLIEVQKGTEVLLYREGDSNILKVTNGTVRFSLPTHNTLSIITPSGMVNVGGPSRLAAKSSSIPLEGGERVGVIRVEKGDTFISSLKDPLEVTTIDGKTRVLRSGETIRLAQAEAGVAGLLEGMTPAQLSALATQEGVTVVAGVAEVPALAAGQVALSIPASLGGGFIVGTPAAISAGLSAIGIVTTAAVVTGAAVAAGAAVGIGTAAVVGAGVVAAGVGVAAAAEEGASPSQ